MTKRIRRCRLICIALLLPLTAAYAAAPYTPVPPGKPGPATVCGRHGHIFTQAWPGAPEYLVRNTYWLGYGPLCVRSTGHNDFVVTRTPLPTNHYNKRLPQQVTSFAAIMDGCQWNMCSPHADLPIQTFRIAHLRTSWSTVSTAKGTWDTAYDLWFDKHRMVQGHSAGAEILVMVNHGGACCWWPAPRTIHIIGGYKVRIRAANAYDNGVAWKYIQFRLVNRSQGVHNMDLRPFFNYALAHGWIKSGWWLNDLSAGFEVWSGGLGLRTKGFSVALQHKPGL